VLALLDHEGGKGLLRHRNKTAVFERDGDVTCSDSTRIPARFISRGDVNRAFVGFESNKYEVASALARQFPDLASRLPPKRKIWQSEDYRMGIFDAAALGAAYFVRRRSVKLRLPENETGVPVGSNLCRIQYDTIPAECCAYDEHISHATVQVRPRKIYSSGCPNQALRPVP